MKVLIFSSDRIDTSAFDAEFKCIDWSSVNSIENINFSDYDGLIFDVDSLVKKRKENAMIRLPNFERQISPKIIADILGRKDSFVSIVGDPTTKLQTCCLISLLGVNITVKRLSGTNITGRCNTKNFKDYWKKIKSYNYYFERVEDNIPINGTSAKHISVRTYDEIKNRSGYIIGTCICFVDNLGCRIDSGEMSFVPPLEGDKQETIASLLSIYIPTGGTIEPKWAQKILVFGQTEIDKKIADTKGKIQSLTEELDVLKQKRTEMRRDIALLYESDKVLEETVKTAMSKIGYEVEESKEKNNIEFCLKHKKSKYVVEIKSTSKDAIDKKGLRQVIEWKEDKFLETGEEYKPLLIVSTQFKDEPNKRENNILPNNLSGYVKTRGIAILKVVTLFDMLQSVLSKKYTIEEIDSMLFQANSIVEFD